MTPTSFVLDYGFFITNLHVRWDFERPFLPKEGVPFPKINHLIKSSQCNEFFKLSMLLDIYSSIWWWAQKDYIISSNY